MKHEVKVNSGKFDRACHECLYTVKILEMLDSSIEAIELQLKSIRHQMVEVRSKAALHKQNLQNSIVLNNHKREVKENGHNK